MHILIYTNLYKHSPELSYYISDAIVNLHSVHPLTRHSTARLQAANLKIISRALILPLICRFTNCPTTTPMFKKISNRFSEHGGETPLDELFWCSYLEGYDKFKSTKIPNPNSKNAQLLPYNPKKYSSTSINVLQLQKRFEHNHLPVPGTHELAAALKSPFSMGDTNKAYEWIRYFQLGTAGHFVTNNTKDKIGRTITYKGAENWENVMCYMDALLFSMFAHLESFEPILFISNLHENRLIDQLSVLLRVYVNFLRLGKLITIDLTIRICEILSKLGFTEAMSHKQQDAAVLFQFLTETLSMPLLTFKVEIKHAGKVSKVDDFKYLKERMLFVSIPDEDEDEDDSATLSGKPIEEATPEQLASLQQKEQEVLKGLEQAAELTEFPTTKNTSDVSHGTSDILPNTVGFTADTKLATAVEEKSGVNPTLPIPAQAHESDEILLEECLEHYFSNSISVRRELERRATMESLRRAPSDSAVSTKLEPTTEQYEYAEKHPEKPKNRKRSSTISLWSLDSKPNKPREVNLPAWMFLRLLPFYTDEGASGEPVAQSSRDFARRRPILPLCLKRYSFDTQARRSKRRIIIPPVIRLPQFVADEEDQDVAGDFKLILESAVCHRGTSINSGHFISLVRKNANNLNEAEEEANNAPWYLYDDMKKERVVETTFHEAFATEWPYMLFYRLVENGGVKITPVQGAKDKWWKEELGPITLGEKDQSLAALDISEKYFWYTTDNDNNYQKEVHGSEAPLIRRNSQWSNKSDTEYSLLQVTHELKKLGTGHSTESLKKFGTGHSSESLKKKARSLLSSPRVSSPRVLSPRVGSIDRDGSDVPPLSLDGKLEHKHHKKKKKDAYRKDKCVLM